MIAFTGHFYILFKEKGISVVPAEYFMKSRAFHRDNPPENRLISGIHTVYSDEPRLFDERFGRKSRLFEEREVFMMKKHILCTLFAVVLLFLLSSCAGPAPADSSSSSEQSAVPQLESISLSLADMPAEGYDIGQVLNVEIGVKPAECEYGPFQYESSDLLVADFSNGILTTKSPGTTQLRVLSEDGLVVSNTLTLTVEDFADRERLAALEQAAAEIDEMISSLGSVTAQSGPAIQSVRAQYDQAQPEVKTRVKNPSWLEAAEQNYQTILERQASPPARYSHNLSKSPLRKNLLWRKHRSPSQNPNRNRSSRVRWVYITKTGKRYHYSNSCNGGTYYAATLEEVLRRGLTPCQKCVEYSTFLFIRHFI